MHAYLKLGDCYITTTKPLTHSLAVLIVWLFIRTWWPCECARRVPTGRGPHSIVVVHDHLFELLERDRLVARAVVLPHDLVDLLVWNLATHLGHRVLDVLFGDLVVSVDVELSEDRFQFLVGQELLHTDRSRQEFGVVNKRVPVVIEFRDDFLQFLRPNLMVVVHQSLLKLLDLDEARVVGVDFLKQVP